MRKPAIISGKNRRRRAVKVKVVVTYERELISTDFSLQFNTEFETSSSRTDAVKSCRNGPLQGFDPLVLNVVSTRSRHKTQSTGSSCCRRVKTHSGQ